MVSLVIPAYNEEKRIEKTIETFYKYMDKTFSSYEIIVVNDGSTDNTLEVLKGYTYSDLRVLSYKENRGKGGAVRHGILNARGDYIFFTDADMPYPIENIKYAIDLFLKEDYDLILGNRLQKENGARYPWYRSLMSKSFSMFVDMALHLNEVDTQCGFKGFRRDAANAIFKKSTLSGWGFDVEVIFIAKKLGLKIGHIDVELFHDNNSKIKVISDSINIFKDLMNVRKNDKNGLYE